MIISPILHGFRAIGRPRRAAGACLLVMTGVTACQDASSDPLALVVTEETAPAIALERALPALPVLVSTTGLEVELAGPVADWTASWEDLGDRSARDAAIEAAAPELAEVLGEGGVYATLRPLQEAVRALESLDELPPDLAATVEDVRFTVHASEAALRTGRLESALRDGLMASDRLREVGPQAVARVLVARGDQLLTRLDETPDGSLDTLSRDRARGLITRARRALEEGDYTLALQRAYYAAMLLEPR